MIEPVIDAIDGIRRNSAFSFAAGVIIFISSLVFGIFVVSLLNLDAFSKNIGEQVYIEAYLRPGVSDEKGELLASAAGTIEGVKDVRFVRSSDAMDRLSPPDGSMNLLIDMDLMGFVPSSLEVSVESPKYVKPVADTLNEYADVENVRHGDDVAEKTLVLITAARRACVILLAMMAACTVVVIGVVAAMTVSSERENISTLRLLGATEAFILKPYLIEGALLGGIASISAMLVLRFFYGAMVSSDTLGISVLVFAPAYPVVYIAGFAMVLAGIVFGVSGSFLAVRYYFSKKELA